MQSSAFPLCCGLNILHGFAYGSTPEAVLATLKPIIKEYETGKLSVAYCGEHGNSPHLRAHVVAITGKQMGTKGALELLGYRELGSFPGPHLYGAGEGSPGFYRIYLMGKGFDAPGKDAKQ